MLDVYADELKALETDYQNTKIFESLSNREFTAPSYLHDTLERKIMEMATLCPPVPFEVQEEAFQTIAHDKHSDLKQIGRQHKCQIKIQDDTKISSCEIPKATTQDHVSNKLTAAAITIHQDDLAEQKVMKLRFERDSDYSSFINVFR